MSKWVHRMSNLDFETMTGDCANCGRVKVRVKGKGTRFSCPIGDRQYHSRKGRGLCVHCGGVAVIEGQTLCNECKDKNAKCNRVTRRKQKLAALTHYGKGGQLHCCWNKCRVTDIDMLTIDHINDDGAQDRRNNSVHIYSRLIKLEFPEGFQTLCFNHQWKKRLNGLRELSSDYDE